MKFDQATFLHSVQVAAAGPTRRLLGHPAHTCLPGHHVPYKALKTTMVFICFIHCLLVLFCLVIVLLHVSSPGRRGFSNPLDDTSPAKIAAIVDLGSAFTIGNWPAGKLAGLEPRGPNVRYNGQVGQVKPICIRYPGKILLRHGRWDSDMSFFQESSL